MAGVYISYPFCNQKCSFCNFASNVAVAEVQERYGRALLDEVESHHWEFTPETVYFGGGTPSLMPPELLTSLLGAIPGAGLTEVTLECAPGTVTRERVAHWQESGVNRVSLGVQSFVTSELRRVGRRHTAETVEHDVQVLRTDGIDNINLDLIAGLPGQTSDSWAESLKWSERLATPHASVYLFEVDEESRLGKEAIRGGSRYGAAELPGDDLCAELYEAAVERLEQLGLSRYEISNFARPGYRSRHNLKYWQLEPYAGFGLDAHSFNGRVRWSNPDALPDYFEQKESSMPAELVSLASDAAEEHFFVGLRMADGIVPNPEERARFASQIERWTTVGMLEWAGDRLRLSRRGFLVSNEIFQEFIAGS